MPGRGCRLRSASLEHRPSHTMASVQVQGRRWTECGPRRVSAIGTTRRPLPRSRIRIEAPVAASPAATVAPPMPEPTMTMSGDGGMASQAMRKQVSGRSPQRSFPP